MIGTMIGLGCANDLFNLWVWFEAMAVSSYLLVAFYTHEQRLAGSRREVPGAIAVGSVLVLMGIALVFSQAGTLQLDEIAAWHGPMTALPSSWLPARCS